MYHCDFTREPLMPMRFSRNCVENCIPEFSEKAGFFFSGKPSYKIQCMKFFQLKKKLGKSFSKKYSIFYLLYKCIFQIK
jgi:hypothetical protein